MKENKLIAEFLGWELQDNPTERWYGSYREQNGILHKNTDKEPLLFHTSWDWLMPVVEKIKRTDLSREMVMQGMDELIDAFDTDIETTYNAVVEFIKQLNKEL